MEIGATTSAAYGRLTKSATASSPANKVGAAADTTGSQPATALSLSPLAENLKGPALDLFNKLKSHEREVLGQLVEGGQMTGDDVNNALMDVLKQSRRSAFASGSMQFESRNAALFTHADTATGKDVRNATDDTLSHRKALASRLDELRKNGAEGSEDYAATLRGLSGDGGGSSTGRMAANGPPRSTRILSPYSMSLGDGRLVQTNAEKTAGEKLASSGVNLSSLTDAARSMAEDDVAAMVSTKADELATTLDGTGG